MPDTSIAGTVLVSIVSAVVHSSEPAWDLQYDVRNTSRNAVWLVDDDFLVLRQYERRIELSYAREKMQPGASVFGYFPPKVAEIPPGDSVRRTVHITWPCTLSTLWNSQRELAPPPGEYQALVRVGFGGTAAPDPPALGESVEDPVLRWQHTAASEPVKVAIPRY